MSQSTCKFILVLAIALLTVMSLLSPQECSYALSGCANWLSILLSFLFLTGMAAFLSYMNRSIFVVSSDRFTLPLIFSLTAMADSRSMVFSTHHIVAFLTLIALFFMLRLIVTEEFSRSDYFVWCLLISCAAAFVPQLFWLLIPGYFVSAGRTGTPGSFKLFLITVAAITVPLIYLASWHRFFSDGVWYEALSEIASGIILFEWPAGFSSFKIFYSSVMGIVVLSSAVAVLKRYEQIRNTSLRKQYRFIFPYFVMVCIILSTGSVDISLMMVFAIPWSLLFLYYGELTGYGRGWRHLLLLMAVSTLVFRASSFI